METGVSHLTWSADQVLIRQGVTALLRNLFMGSGPLIFHTLICGRGGGRRGRGVQSPEFNKSDLLVMICILNQKWRLARPSCCYSPDSFVRRQKCLTVSDTVRGRILAGEAGPNHQWSHQNLDLLPILTAASDGWSVESFVQTSEWVLSDHEILRLSGWLCNSLRRTGLHMLHIWI